MEYLEKNHKFPWWLEILNYPSGQGPLDGPVEDASAHGRGVGPDELLRSIPTQTILCFCDLGTLVGNTVRHWVTLGKSGICWPNYFL